MAKIAAKKTAVKKTAKTEPVSGQAAGLQPGDKAPAFRLPTDQGGTVALSALKGQTLVLYFYPKDDTSGCTKQAIDFSSKAKQFAAAGAVVIGVSKDSVTSHDAFKAKHRLTLTLASDEETKTAAAYGVWVEKSMYGRRYMGMERATFLIDGKGVVRQVWRKVKVPGHVDEVLAAVKAL
jgi:peroxiredoxin Q/BCP